MIAKQMEVRSNIKKYFDLAYEGEPVIIPRKNDRNVVIISEVEYNRMQQFGRFEAYSNTISKLNQFGTTPKHPTGSHSSTQLTSQTVKGSVKARNIEKLSIIRSLKDGWNGNGAPSFSSTLIDRVEELIDGLSIQPEIFPTALGSIQIEYDNSRRDHMEIEISEEDMAEIFIVYYNGEESIEKIPSTIDCINERVSDFYG
jgi:hypothetical protein